MERKELAGPRWGPWASLGSLGLPWPTFLSVSPGHQWLLRSELIWETSSCPEGRAVVGVSVFNSGDSGVRTTGPLTWRLVSVRLPDLRASPQLHADAP